MFSHLSNICLSLSLRPDELFCSVCLFSECLLATLDLLQLLLFGFSFFLFKLCSIFCRTSTNVKDETPRSNNRKVFSLKKKKRKRIKWIIIIFIFHAMTVHLHIGQQPLLTIILFILLLMAVA